MLARGEELYEAVFIHHKFSCGLAAVRDGTEKPQKIKQSKRNCTSYTYIYIVILEGFVSFVKHTALVYTMRTKA